LSTLAGGDPAAWIGARGLEATGGRPIFPLLVKLIDGQADLSIQVHPDDRAAAAAGLGTGKTEAYHILAAEPGSVIYLGLDPEVNPEEFAASCLRANGSAAGCLRRVPAEPGMTVLIPAGTPHALGAGILLYEIQQPSNVTFRLDDWGRVDASGAARALHHHEGLALVDPLSRPEPIPPVSLGHAEADRALLVATSFFALERIALVGDAIVYIAAVDSPQVLTPVAGALMLDASGWVTSVATGETVILPAGQAATLSARRDSVLMRGWVPDLELDVINPARAAGALDAAIRGLGVPLANVVGSVGRAARESAHSGN
jgi:mannose-6-phosphate isomerase